MCAPPPPRGLERATSKVADFTHRLLTPPGAAPATMERVRAFLGLAPFPFDTSVAFNTESRRGAVIAHSNASHNAQAAAAAGHSHGEAGGGKLRAVERLVADTVFRTDAMLRDSKWQASPHQHRRAVPAAWLERYSKLAARPGSESSL